MTRVAAEGKVGGTANFNRLQAVKRKHDPNNVFSSTPFAQVLASDT
jgi:FAD/FMN-containing dehydrogenase